MPQCVFLKQQKGPDATFRQAVHEQGRGHRRHFFVPLGPGNPDLRAHVCGFDRLRPLPALLFIQIFQIQQWPEKPIAAHRRMRLFFWIVHTSCISDQQVCLGWAVRVSICCAFLLLITSLVLGCHSNSAVATICPSIHFSTRIDSPASGL